MQEFPRVEKREYTVMGQPALVYVGGEGPRTVMLLHGGWGGAAMHWSGVWDRFAQHFRVVAPELPGLGDRSTAGCTSLGDYVNWLNALLGELGVTEVLCVGNSFGASLAWSFAGRNPACCVGVVLVDGYPMPRTPPILRWLGKLALGRNLLRRMVRRSYSPNAWLPAFADTGHAPAELRTLLNDAPSIMIETFLDCLIEGDGPPTPKAPVLIVWGESDHLPTSALKVGKKLAVKLPGSRFVSLANAGHFPQLERPEQFVEVIESFMTQSLMVHDGMLRKRKPETPLPGV